MRWWICMQLCLLAGARGSPLRLRWEWLDHYCAVLLLLVGGGAWKGFHPFVNFCHEERRGEERREDDKSEQTVWLTIPLDILCDSP